MKKYYIIYLSLIFIQCGTPGVMKGDKLGEEDLSYMASLGILDDDEEIILFSSNFDIIQSGNYYSNKRLASYWQYKKSPRNNYIKSAKYDEIDSIKAVQGGFKAAPKIVAYLANGERMEFYFDCENSEVSGIKDDILQYMNK